MKTVWLAGELSRYAARSRSIRIFLHPAISGLSPVDVGDLVRVSLQHQVYDGEEMYWEETEWWRGRVVFRFLSALAELPDSLLLKEVPGFRTRDELMRTLSRMADRAIDVWDVVEVVGIRREEYDLNELNVTRLEPDRRAKCTGTGRSHEKGVA